MPIEVSCPSCTRQFRVPDKVAGKKIKCPKCQGVLPVPGPGSGVGSSVGVGSGVGVASGSQVAAGGKWYMKTADGAQYGPVPKFELDQWQAEGRITPESQLLEEGSPQWQWATDVYPTQPGPIAAAENIAQAAAPAPAAPAPASNDNPFAGLGDSSSPAASGGPAPSSDPFSFAGADTSPTSRLRGGRRGRGGKRRGGRRSGKRSGLVTAVAVINYIIGVGSIVGCLIFAMIIMSASAAIQQGATDPEAADMVGWFAGTFGIVFAIVGVIVGSVHLAAGWGVQNREQWGRILTLILGGMAILSMNLLYGIFVLFVLLNKEYAEEFR